MGRSKDPRQCGRCHLFTSEAMFLVRGREVCAKCGAGEITDWNRFVLALDQDTHKKVAIGNDWLKGGQRNHE